MDFYFTHEHKSGIFTHGFTTNGKCIWCSLCEIKIDLTLKKSNILNLLHVSGFYLLYILHETAGIHIQKCVKSRRAMVIVL